MTLHEKLSQARDAERSLANAFRDRDWWRGCAVYLNPTRDGYTLSVRVAPGSGHGLPGDWMGLPLLVEEREQAFANTYTDIQIDWVQQLAILYPRRDDGARAKARAEVEALKRAIRTAACERGVTMRDRDLVHCAEGNDVWMTEKLRVSADLYERLTGLPRHDQRGILEFLSGT